MNFFITGGSRGIGASIVLEAVAAGHDVAFTFVNQEAAARQVTEEARTLRPEAKCRYYRLDVSDSAQVEEVGDQVLDDFDTVEVVVNNAAVTRDNLAVSMSDEEWLEVIHTNLSGAFYVARKFLIPMLAARFGRIINISSVGAAGSTGQVNYSAAKAGLLGLTKSLAKEYGPRGITSNVLLPGLFDTDMTQDTASEQNREFWIRHCPVRRLGRPPEISKVVIFLASEAASYINGQELWLTGGLNYAP